MKRKIISALFVAVIITACGCDDKNNTATSITTADTVAQTEPESTEPVTTAAVTKDIPKMSFYRRNKDSGTFEPGKNISSEWSYHNDIASFYVFPENAQADGFSYDGFTDYWKNLWAEYEDCLHAKIAYELTIKLKDGTDIVKNITKPSDADEFYNYIEIYLYDDIHQAPGAWYSHLTDAKLVEETLMTSIKITAGVDVDKVALVGIKTYSYLGEDTGDTHSSYITLYNTI